MADAAIAAGFTVPDVARRYRVGQSKVRSWIDRGELRAINVATALCGRPRWVIPVEALSEFEERRAGGEGLYRCMVTVQVSTVVCELRTAEQWIVWDYTYVRIEPAHIWERLRYASCARAIAGMCAAGAGMERKPL